MVFHSAIIELNWLVTSPHWLSHDPPVVKWSNNPLTRFISFFGSSVLPCGSSRTALYVARPLAVSESRRQAVNKNLSAVFKARARGADVMKLADTSSLLVMAPTRPVRLSTLRSSAGRLLIVFRWCVEIRLLQRRLPPSKSHLAAVWSRRRRCSTLPQTWMRV